MKTTTPIVLKTSETEFIELSDVERYDDDSGYRSQIRVGSGEFVCTGRRFIFSHLDHFLKDLKKCHAALAGTAELRPTYEDEYIRFEFIGRGHVKITGLLLDYGGMERKFQFGFETDQSFIAPFIRNLDVVLAELRL